ncbi:hypothetical protein JTE90_006279 [Oedothorax gibbosus]|uniref:DNA repair and recombination protein RAD54-like n=1 Tax=Oedothorax gibbosus TaxID=931172 RepID=A0AAV6U6H4_9ARAC|nr:hypothetical protein JTE90_006279 [Oedothorax gibbosus]
MEEVSSSQTSDFDGLTGLGVRSFEHSELEREVSEQVERAIREQREQDASKELRSVEEDIRSVRQRLAAIEKAISMAPRDPAKMTGEARRELQAIRHEKENKRKHLRKIEAKRRALQVCISGGNIQDVGSSTQVDEALGAEVDGDLDQETLVRLREVFAPQETEEERLIRTGQATPFGTRSISIPENTDFDRFLLESAENHAAKKKAKPPRPSPAKPNCIVVKNDKKEPFKFTDLKAAPVKKKRNRLLNIQNGVHKEEPSPKKKKQIERRDLVRNYASDSDVSCHDNNEEEDEAGKYSDEDVYIPDEDTSDDEWDEGKKEKKKGGQKGAKSSNSESSKAKSRAKKLVDDGDQASYIKRINKWQLQRKHQRILESPDGVVDSDEEEESVDLEEGLKVPNFIWDKLYTYQHTCVRWLWELHRQECGGILGDEMGLGKTIQVIAFLAALSHSKLREPPSDSFRGLGPVVLVCPTTVMHQWVKEFHTWWPPFRVAILHDSGSFQGKKGSLISMINRACGILVMSYGGLVQHQDRLLAHEWHYIILDEGHKIRNPDAQATIAAKRFRTCHRLLLSGSPIQNHLRELWSLFDFVFPSKLGTLPAFTQHFSVPIVQTAYKCATVLRDAIRPYLLRRMKSDVNMHINLPSKSEQVLFCKLTEEQVNLYKGYLDSKEVSSILNSKLQIFVGLVNLRKICNHPDLFDGGPKLLKGQDEGSLPEEERYGYPGRSGKMVVVAALLKLWRSQGHRVLLFTQGRQMMEILESFVKSKGYTYMRMDGTTPISTRQPAVQKFNSDPSVFVFLLTTRVGGLGVNLTGADRVLLYDPDWNPSTDAQARERAWRIGQLRSVTVYRLLTAGTIEEKIYHRQIFKQFVSQRVLKDPRQRRFFKSNDLFELFAYSEPGTQGTETSAIFAGTGSLIKPKDTPNPNRKVKEKAATQEINPAEVEVKFSEEKREQMRQLARKLAMQITQGTKNAPPAQCETSTILQPVSANHPSKSPERNQQPPLRMPLQLSVKHPLSCSRFLQTIPQRVPKRNQQPPLR